MVRCIVCIVFYMGCVLVGYASTLTNWYLKKREKICFWFRFCCRRLRKNVLRFQCVHNKKKQKKITGQRLGMGRLCG